MQFLCVKSERQCTVFKVGSLLQLHLHVLRVLLCSPKFPEKNQETAYFCHKADGSPTSLPPETSSPPTTPGSSNRCSTGQCGGSGCCFPLHRFPTGRSLVLTDDFFPTPVPTQPAVWPQSPQLASEITHGGPQKHHPSQQCALPRITSGAPFPHSLQETASGAQAFPGLGPCGHLLAPDGGAGARSEAEDGGQWRAHHQMRPGVACSSQMPLSLPAELELNHRSARLEPCAAAASAAAARARATRRA